MSLVTGWASMSWRTMKSGQRHAVPSGPTHVADDRAPDEALCGALIVVRVGGISPALTAASDASCMACHAAARALPSGALGDPPIGRK